MNIKLYIAFISCAICVQTHAQTLKIGTYVFRDGAQYSGEMKAGKPHGKGKTVFKNGDTYEGEYVKGKRQGYGVYQFTDGENTKGNGIKTSSTVKVCSISRTTIIMTDFGIAITNKAPGKCIITTAMSIKVIGRPTNAKDKERIRILRERITKELGRTTRNRATECLIGMTGRDIPGLGAIIKEMGKVRLHIPTAMFI